MQGYQMNPVNDFYFRNSQQQMNQQLQLPFQQQFQFPPAPQPQAPVIHAGWVTNIEEAKAAQIDFLATNVYLDTGTGKIYLKRIGDNGKPQFISYAIEDHGGQQDFLAEINARLSNIETFLGGLKHESVSGNAGIQQSGPDAHAAAAEQNESDGAAKPAGIPENAGTDFWKKRK